MVIEFEFKVDGDYIIDLEDNNKGLVLDNKYDIYDLKTVRMDGGLKLFEDGFYNVIIQEDKNGEYILLKDEVNEVCMIVERNQEIIPYFERHRLGFEVEEYCDFIYAKNIKQMTRVSIEVEKW